ncbi:MAG: terminase small subunit [Alistipes indistinctus]
MAKGLTIKQEKFCNKYLECGNASEAYRLRMTARR